MVKLLYFSSLVVCFLTSLFTYKYNKGLKVFPLLMGTTLAVEIVSHLLSNNRISPFPIYHFFIPVNGVMFAYIFYYSVDSKSTRKIISIATGLFVTATLLITVLYYRLADFPGIPLNILGIFSIAMSLFVILTLNPIYEIPIYKHPLTWICLGIIVFFTGTFFLNGIYNYLIETRSRERIMVHNIINNGLNCFMYSCFAIGMICSHRLKKYMQS